MKRLWWGVIIAVIAGFIAASVIWAYQIAIPWFQIIIIIVIILVLSLVYLIMKFTGGTSSKLEPTSKIIKRMFEEWKKESNEDLTLEGHRIRIKFFPEVSKHFLGGVFERQNSPFLIHLIYCVEDKRIWASADIAEASELTDPLYGFNPSQAQVKVDKRGRMVMPIELRPEMEQDEEITSNKKRKQP